MQPNVDPSAVAQFERLATRWWDPDGESRALHDLNPARLGYVMERVELRGLDVGCGGGLLSEALAAQGAKVTGIDLAPAVLETARLHLYESGLQVDYREIAAEALAAECEGGFDVITCMEMLEHVPDPAAVIDACARLLRSGGWLFLSTLNRTPQAFALAIAGAEYVMRLLPRETLDCNSTTSVGCNTTRSRAARVSAVRPPSTTWRRPANPHESACGSVRSGWHAGR